MPCDISVIITRQVIEFSITRINNILGEESIHVALLRHFYQNKKNNNKTFHVTWNKIVDRSSEGWHINTLVKTLLLILDPVPFEHCLLCVLISPRVIFILQQGIKIVILVEEVETQLLASCLLSLVLCQNVMKRLQQASALIFRHQSPGIWLLSFFTSLSLPNTLCLICNMGSLCSWVHFFHAYYMEFSYVVAQLLRNWFTDQKVGGSNLNTTKLPLLGSLARPLTLSAPGMLYPNWPCALAPTS